MIHFEEEESECGSGGKEAARNSHFFIAPAVLAKKGGEALPLSCLEY